MLVDPSGEAVITDNGSSPLIYGTKLDASNLNRPLSLSKAKLELDYLPNGRVLRMITADAGSQQDFRAFVQFAGHELPHGEATKDVY